jgi:hypothetical protein
MIKDEYRKDWVSRVKKHMNFFKHADRKQPDSVDDFSPEVSELMIVFAFKGLKYLKERINSDTEQAYFAWLMIHRPELFKKVPPNQFPHNVPADAQWTARNRKERVSPNVSSS